MDNEITGMLLQGITGKEFTVFFLVGIIGIIVRFLFNLWQGITKDPTTPFTFEFPYFIKGLVRVVLSLLILALVIARFQEFSHLLVGIELPAPTVYAHGEQPVATLTTGTSFILGLGLDEVIKRLVGAGDEGRKVIMNKIKSNGTNS